MKGDWQLDDNVLPSDILASLCGSTCPEDCSNDDWTLHNFVLQTREDGHTLTLDCGKT